MNHRLRSLVASALFLVLASCSSDPPTLITYSRMPANTGTLVHSRAPVLSDELALDYANAVESIFRSKSTNNRYAREASATALAAIGIFTGASKTIGMSIDTAAKFGLASAGIVQLQHILDAKGRAAAYFDAAERIHSAIKDFVAYSLTANNGTIYQDKITPNGWTLANVVQTNIDMVDKVLNGHLPTPEDIIQATEPMSKEGAHPQSQNSLPTNNISRVKPTLPKYQGATGVTQAQLDAALNALHDRMKSEGLTKSALDALSAAEQRFNDPSLNPMPVFDYSIVMQAGGWTIADKATYPATYQGCRKWIRSLMSDANKQTAMANAADAMKP